MTTCEPCNGSGEVAISTSTLNYRCPGPVPDYARGVVGVKCAHCNGSGEQPDPRDPDHGRTGIFVHHNCGGCKDGALPCREGRANSCGWPRARND